MAEITFDCKILISCSTFGVLLLVDSVIEASKCRFVVGRVTTFDVQLFLVRQVEFHVFGNVGSFPEFKRPI